MHLQCCGALGANCAAIVYNYLVFTSMRSYQSFLFLPQEQRIDRKISAGYRSRYYSPNPLAKRIIFLASNLYRLSLVILRMTSPPAIYSKTDPQTVISQMAWSNGSRVESAGIWIVTGLHARWEDLSGKCTAIHLSIYLRHWSQSWMYECVGKPFAMRDDISDAFTSS